MRMTQVAGVIIVEASIFLLCAYAWGPYHTPLWTLIPALVMWGAACIIIAVEGYLKRRLGSRQSLQ
jgi:hypothetical protein